jgi:hypothetical protein
VDYEKLVQALVDAADLSNISSEARLFVDNHAFTIAYILMREKDEIKARKSEQVLSDWLKSIVHIVSEDLAAASQSGHVCKTLPAFLELFDEVHDRRWGDAPLGLENLLPNLVAYLKASDTHPLLFPKWDAIMTILKQLKPFGSCDDTFDVVRMVMIRLAIEEELLRLDDDALDILKEIKAAVNYHPPKKRRNMPYFIELYRDVILCMIHSQKMSLKQIGWDQIDTVIKYSVKLRPYPLGLLVIGAGDEEINGTYVIEPDNLSDNGFLSGVGYIKIDTRGDEDNNANGPMIAINDSWSICRTDKLGKRCELYYRWSTSEFERDRPTDKTTWYVGRKGSVSPGPIVEHIGLIDFRKALERDIIKWAINDILELAVKDVNCSPCDDVRDSAATAIMSVLGSVETYLDLVVKTMSLKRTLRVAENDQFAVANQDHTEVIRWIEDIENITVICKGIDIGKGASHELTLFGLSKDDALDHLSRLRDRLKEFIGMVSQ